MQEHPAAANPVANLPLPTFYQGKTLCFRDGDAESRLIKAKCEELGAIASGGNPTITIGRVALTEAATANLPPGVLTQSLADVQGQLRFHASPRGAQYRDARLGIHAVLARWDTVLKTLQADHHYAGQVHFLLCNPQVVSRNNVMACPLTCKDLTLARVRMKLAAGSYLYEQQRGASQRMTVFNKLMAALQPLLIHGKNGSGEQATSDVGSGKSTSTAHRGSTPRRCHSGRVWEGGSPPGTSGQGTAPDKRELVHTQAADKEWVAAGQRVGWFNWEGKPSQTHPVGGGGVVEGGSGKSTSTARQGGATRRETAGGSGRAAALPGTGGHVVGQGVGGGRAKGGVVQLGTKCGG
jgi:hypothetical protein